jgi:hypothetical protein
MGKRRHKFQRDDDVFTHRRGRGTTTCIEDEDDSEDDDEKKSCDSYNHEKQQQQQQERRRSLSSDEQKPRALRDFRDGDEDGCRGASEAQSRPNGNGGDREKLNRVVITRGI